MYQVPSLLSDVSHLSLSIFVPARCKSFNDIGCRGAPFFFAEVEQVRKGLAVWQFGVLLP